MQDLQLVGVHDDGEHILLETTDGQRFLLVVDDRLRAAVRRDRPRLGQLQIAIDGGMRPADIQARIRAGATAEEVAAAAGLPVEHVRRYEGPVLAEREHVCARARRLPVRQREGSGRSPQLEVLVQERLQARGVADGTEWDAWRRDDGSWTVQLTFHAGAKDRRAQWAFDVARSTVEALDDEARWLSALEGTTDDGPLPGRRLAAVREHVYDVEADGGVRATRRTAGQPALPHSGLAPTHPTDLLDALQSRRGRRGQVLDLEQLEATEAELEATAASPPTGRLDPVPAAHPPASRPEEAQDGEVLALPEEQASGASGPQPEPGSRSRSRRASVPSWDEIVFGAKRD